MKMISHLLLYQTVGYIQQRQERYNLVEEPDGRPLMSVKGDAEFTGTQTVTVSFDKCEQAGCSVDGGNSLS